MRSGRELEINLKTDAAGLKLVMAAKGLACETPEAPRRTLRSIYLAQFALAMHGPIW